MRKFVTVLGLALLSALQAAPAQAQGVEIGFKGGLNFAKFGGKDASGEGVESSNLTGYTVGGLLNFGLGSVLSFQPELLYTLKGSTYKSLEGDGKFKFGYVDVPLLAVIRTPLQGAMPIRPYLLAGPVLGFRADCSVEVTDGTSSASTKCSNGGDFVDFKKTDVGLALGGGVGVPVGAGSLLFDARYGMGLTKLDNSSNAADVKNRSFAFTLGYSLRFGL
jgi:hypothetical protein